ncbi:hypothetical protein BDF20DRAFT_842237 [Mycotypha africana]|uniref:uncharacterized protein n=1 Tax=Mycotypha africana TaxID=64632 RepID=UPI0022FFD4C7|nr:uncharacterized protein BDF20DRAFT_842237 [Mycotypha africana]KAI8991017.1 hypothetical protein BDF20DRAFT_842237 [Mycotypha africana]
MYGSSFNSNSTARLSTSRSSSQESASQDGLYGYNSDYSEPVPPTSASHRSHQHPRHSQQQQQHEQPPHSMSSSHLNGMHPQTISTTSTSTFMNNDNNDDYNVNLDLVKDVPAWLRSMRLHKYNPIFEKMRWQDIIQLDDEALKTKGVAALGARRKMLKVFDQVKEYCQQNNIEYST